MPLKMNEATRRLEPMGFDYSQPELAMAKRVGERIAEARRIRKVSQTQAAAMIGVGQNTFSNYERGASRMDYAKLAELALKLQMKPEALMGGLLSDGASLDVFDDPRGSMLKRTYSGAYWPVGAPLPNGDPEYSFTVYECSDELSLAVVKAEPDVGRAIDASTDHVRMVVPGSADHAVMALEHELASDKEYLAKRGLDPAVVAARGAILDCPHPADAFSDVDDMANLEFTRGPNWKGDERRYEPS